MREQAQNSGKPVLAHPSFLRSAIYSATTTPNVLQSFAYKSRAAIFSILESFHENIGHGRIIPAFSDLRAIIEHVAHTAYAMRQCKLVLLPAPGKPEALAEYLGAIRTALTKSQHATRLDWKQLFKDEAPIRKRKLVPYDAGSSLIDVTATNILTLISKMEKTVPGLGNIYQFLCEFAHPNLGTNAAFFQETKMIDDEYGILWKEIRLGLTEPKAFQTDMGRFTDEVLSCVVECVQHVITLHEEIGEFHVKICAIVRELTRALVARQPELFNLYSSCPCQSGKKLKFCCLKSDS